MSRLWFKPLTEPLPELSPSKIPPVQFRVFSGLQDYADLLAAMRTFTENRQPDTPDEVWFLQHTPVLTQGQAGKPEHVLNAQALPVIQTDRGGQVTWHGPGQVVCYTLLDLRRLGWHVRDLVDHAEASMLSVLQAFGLSGIVCPDAPGIYLDGHARSGHCPAPDYQVTTTPAITRQPHHPSLLKIGSLGFKMRRNGCYHGMAFNVDCDLSSFNLINPCGYASQQVTRLLDWVPDSHCNQVIQHWQAYWQTLFRQTIDTVSC